MTPGPDVLLWLIAGHLKKVSNTCSKKSVPLKHPNTSTWIWSIILYSKLSLFFVSSYSKVFCSEMMFPYILLGQISSSYSIILWSFKIFHFLMTVKKSDFCQSVLETTLHCITFPLNSRSAYLLYLLGQRFYSKMMAEKEMWNHMFL